jgi:hypothetical protein
LPSTAPPWLGIVAGQARQLRFKVLKTKVYTQAGRIVLKECAKSDQVIRKGWWRDDKCVMVHQ